MRILACLSVLVFGLSFSSSLADVPSVKDETTSLLLTTTRTPYPHYIRSCSYSQSYANLDIVFLFDSTSKAAADGFDQQVAFLSDYISNFRIGSDPQYSQVALLNVADDISVVANLTTITDASQASQVVQTAQFQNGTSFNLGSALATAGDFLQGGRAGNKKAAVVLSTHSFACDSKKRSFYNSKEDPCSQVQRFVQNDWTIITVGLRFGNQTSYPTIALGWPCYEIKNNYNYWSEYISDYLSQINCYCPSGFTQLTDGCYKYGECELPATFNSARSVCRKQNFNLTTVYNSAKELLLKNIALAAGTSQQQFFPFYLGLHKDYNVQDFFWDNGQKLQGNDYQNWYDNTTFSNPPYYETCPILAIINGFQTAWRADYGCSQTYAYFCETTACE